MYLQVFINFKPLFPRGALTAIFSAQEKQCCIQGSTWGWGITALKYLWAPLKTSDNFPSPPTRVGPSSGSCGWPLPSAVISLCISPSRDFLFLTDALFPFLMQWGRDTPQSAFGFLGSVSRGIHWPHAPSVSVKLLKMGWVNFSLLILLLSGYLVWIDFLVLCFFTIH